MIGEHLVTLGARGANSELGALTRCSDEQASVSIRLQAAQIGRVPLKTGKSGRGVLLLHTDALANVIPAYRVAATCTAGLKAEHDLTSQRHTL